MRDVGEQLGVSHVLEGSVRRAGEQLRITAQLIRAADGMHLWSETYNRPEADVLAIQDAIVGDITRALEIRLGVGAGAGRALNHNVDPRAYETYLQGLFLWSTRHVDANRAGALKQLRLASELDPDFADAHAAYGLGLLYTSNSPEVTGVSTEERSAVIERALATALELDPGNARAHAAYGDYYSRLVVDLDKSRKHLQEAIRLAPNSALSHYAMAYSSVLIADFDQVQRSFDRALLLDPLNVTVKRVQAQFHVAAGQWGRAQDYFDKCRTTKCGIPEFYSYDFVSRLHMGQKDEALLALEALESGDADAIFAEFDRLWLSFVRADLESDDPDFRVSFDVQDSDFGDDAYRLIAFHQTEFFDKGVEYLHQWAESESFWSLQDGSLLLSAGWFELPEAFRKYAGYHEFWDRDGWREIAAARIANGHPEGLPLNEDGTPVEF